MQISSELQNYNSEDELSLEEKVDETVVNNNSNENQDEAELVTAEKIQAETTVKGTQVTSSPRGVVYNKIDNQFYTIASMAAGMLVVVAAYAALVLI